MAAAVDVLQTRMEMVGLGGYLGQLGQVTDAIGIFGDKLGAARQRQLAFGVAALAGGAAGFAFLGRAALAAGEDAATFNRALLGFKSRGNPFPLAEMEKFTGKLEQELGIADDEIAATMGLLGTFGFTPDQAKSLTEPIFDAAESLKAIGAEAPAIANAIGKAMESGDFSRLTKMGIKVLPAEITKLGKTGAILEALKRQGAGAAREFRKSLPGSIQAAGVAFGSLNEEIGKGLAPGLNFAADRAAEFANVLKGAPGAAQALAWAIGLGSLALTAYGISTLFVIGQTARLAKKHYQAAAAATVQEKAERRLTTTLAKEGLVGGKRGRGRFGGFAGRAAGLGAGALGFAGRALGPLAVVLGAQEIDDALFEGKIEKAGQSAALAPTNIGDAGADWVKENVLGLAPNEEIWESLGKRFPGAAARGKSALDRLVGLTEAQLAEQQATTKQLSECVGSSEIEKTLGGSRVARNFRRTLG